jgi:translation initiation factor 1 (eIF-1/SUI1)
MTRKRKDLSASSDSAGFGSALADARRDKGYRPGVYTEERALASVWERCPRIRLRKEKKGRRGKTVTMMEGVAALSHDERRQLARQVAGALGAGTSVEGEAVLCRAATASD